MYKNTIKRGLDVVMASVALLVFFPLFLVIMIGIKMDSKGSVFFKQKRIGIRKSDFYILKFRTMRVDTPRDCPAHLLEHPDKYITRFGRFLRKSSLDELPQLLNILFGDMSFVGPRPALWNQEDLIRERDKYGANDVMPGLTGWAQVNGRDELEIPVKAKLDGLYIHKMSFWFDIDCLIRTVLIVVKSKGNRERSCR